MLRCLSESAGCLPVLRLQPRCGALQESLAPLEGSQSGIEREGEGGKMFFWFFVPIASVVKAKKVKEEEKLFLALAFSFDLNSNNFLLPRPLSVSYTSSSLPPPPAHLSPCR
jgi:hypothetical protein